MKTLNWRCSNCKCKATLNTKKSTGNLVSGDLPDHFPGNQLLYKIETPQTKSTYNDVIFPLVEHGLDNYGDWIDYAAELEEFGKYFSNTWICRRNGQSPLCIPKLWNHFESVKEVGPQTNNMLESRNRTLNSLVGHSPNVWHIQDAEARRAYLSDAVGQDMTIITGRKQRSLDARERVKFVVDVCQEQIIFLLWPMEPMICKN